MSKCNHDKRFHLMGALNGCCACELEAVRAKEGKQSIPCKRGCGRRTNDAGCFHDKLCDVCAHNLLTEQQAKIARLDMRILKLQQRCLRVRDAANKLVRGGHPSLQSDCDEFDRLIGQVNTPDLLELPETIKQQQVKQQAEIKQLRADLVLAETAIANRELRLRAADAVCKAIDVAVQVGSLGSRSQIADRRLDYGSPFEYEWTRPAAAEVETE